MRPPKLNYAIRAVLVVLFFTLGAGNAWADSFYTGFKATGGATGKGYVYASTSNTATPVYETEVVAEEKSSDLGSGGTKQYYAWAKAVRGSKFNGWSISGDNGNVTPPSGTNSPITVTVTSAKNKTNTGTAKATWTTYTKVNVTYNPSEDGVYSVTYQYNSYDATTQEITTGDAENLSRTISSENGAQMIGSYNNDVITLKSTSGTFQGWYSDAGFTSLLSTANPYTYTAPTSGSAAVYPKYEHVDKYYGRLIARIAAVPYSMPGGGTIFVSKEEAGTGTYSADAQTVDNIGMGTTGLKYYLHAKPNDKRYVFRGWYSNPECTGTALSTNADYTYTFTATSMNSASPTTGNVYAAFDFNLYYMQVEAEPAVPGLGMVFVKDDNSTTPVYTEYTTHSEQFLYAYRLAPTANAYLYAKPKYGYKFSGWYDNPDCTGTAKSTANPYTYAAKGTSTDPMNPTIIKLYAKFVEDATTVNITYNLPDQTKGEYTASVLDIAEVDDDFVWTFKEVFTSVGKSANTTQAQHKTDVLRMEAQPKAGYGVTSWTIAGAAKTTPSQLYETTGTAAATYGVTFGDAKPFLVSTNSTQYATLREALTAVGNSGQITVVQNAYVEAGNYTIPSGVTLLVPYESTGKSYTSPSTNYEKIQEFSSATQYVLLTLSSGVNISLSGKLIVMADLCAPVGGGAGSGAPLSAYGRIAMSENSTITVNSGANLYCWGYITGKEGLVTAKSGAKIHEIFQHQNNPGGSAASDWNEDAFFLNQYYVQNIESPLKIEYGAIETVYAQMTVPSSTINNLSASLIGKDDVGMFALTSSGSYLIRTYDPSTDRITYDIYGNVKLNYISMSVYGMDLNTSKYVLPITSNMSVKCHTLNGNASTFNIQYAVSFIPGAELFADEGVTLNIQNKLIIYDRDEWIGKNFAQFNKYSGGYNWTRSSFTPTRTYIRVNADLVDAKVDLNGTMNVSGSLYTTNSGAAIISSNGTGVVKLSSAAPGNSNDIQYSANKLGASIKVPMTPAQLHNGDDSYTLTAGAVANDQFIYSKSQEKWLKNPKVVSWNANGGTTEATAMAYSEGSFLGELPAAYKDGYTLEGWYTAADGGSQIAATTKVTAKVTYYAHWTPKSYTITYRDNGGVAFSGTHVDTSNEHPTTHTFGAATALTGATKEHYTFGGWYRTPSCSGAVVTSIAASECKNITLYAKWTVNTHKLAWNFDGGTPSGNYTEANNALAYGSAITYPTLSKTGYTFASWSSDATSMPDADLTITASWTPIQYTITWLNWDGSPLKDPTIETTIEYGGRPAYPTASPAPTRKASDGKTYEWDGWTTGAYGAGTFYRIIDNLPVATVDANYYAHFRITAIDVASNSNISIGEDAEVTTTTVKVSGKLDIAENAELTTDDLILEGSESASGEVIGEVTATHAYFDLSHAGGFKANTWYAVAVPWQVSVTAYAEDNGVYIKNGSDDPIRQTMGTTFDLIYYDGKRRADGAVKAWNFVEDDQLNEDKHYIMEPGRAYMIYLTNDADVIRFERKEGTKLLTTSIEAHKYGDENTPTTLANWNGIANPATYHAYLNVGATDGKGQTYNAETKGYDMFNMSTTPMVVGQPVFVQSAVKGTVVANSSSYSAAPRRAKASMAPFSRYELMFAPIEEEVTDRIIVRMDEDKEENAYVIGQDLVKMGVSDRVPQLWVNRYDSKMCINTVAPVNNTADYPMGISVQKDGEYELFIDDQPNDETMLYLTYDGEAIWNLSYGGYVATLTKGENTHYGLRIVYAERRTPTGIEEATIQNGESIRKVLVDDKVFIIRGEKVYSIDGKLVK